MSAPEPVPLFVDTGVFFARFYERANRHGRALQVFEGIRTGELPYRPLYTSRFVLSETATLLDRKADHATAVDALHRVRASDAFRVLAVDDAGFDRACEEFARYDDQRISFVDHTSAVLAAERNIEHVFTFDRRDFRTLGFTCVPDDT